MYLTAEDLAALCDCRPNQFKLMARRLRERGWPFEQFKPGSCPKVSRSYHDQRMSGTLPAAAAPSNDDQFTPNRAALKALQHARKTRKRAA